MADPLQAWIPRVDPSKPDQDFFGVDRSQPVRRLDNTPRPPTPEAEDIGEVLLSVADLRRLSRALHTRISDYEAVDSPEETAADRLLIVHIESHLPRR